MIVPIGSSRCAKKKHDIFIVLDVSRNVGAQEFRVLKKFLKQFTSQLDVGLDKTHVGILLANPKGQSKVEINLGQHGSSKALASAIGRIKRNGKRRPDMAHALKLVQNKVRVRLFACKLYLQTFCKARVETTLINACLY